MTPADAAPWFVLITNAVLIPLLVRMVDHSRRIDDKATAAKATALAAMTETQQHDTKISGELDLYRSLYHSEQQQRAATDVLLRDERMKAAALSRAHELTRSERDAARRDIVSLKSTMGLTARTGDATDRPTDQGVQS